MTLPGDLWLWLVLAGAAVSAVLALVWPDARTAARVIVQFFATIALPVLVVTGGLLALLLPLLPEIDPRLGQALIAGLVIALGWLTTAIFADLARTRTRTEQRRDYHRAIFAEIRNNLNTLWNAASIDAYAEGLVERMREDQDFVPFIPKEHNDHVYDAILDRLEVLPRKTIDAIVAYYSQIKAISTLVEDMRGETFRSLAQDRRIAMYLDYVEMKKQALVLGTYATNRILDFEARGKPAKNQPISSQVAGRSARSAVSE